MRLKALFILLSFAIILSSGCELLGKKKSKFCGTWRTTLGKMTLVQQGNKISGTFSNDGRIEGAISGDTLKFRWWEANETVKTYGDASLRGDGYFLLSADGDTIDGQWRKEGDNEYHSTWWGPRIVENN